jgi:DNA polymerase I-like protein with 3'-5' exonuclease and polymerase domains
MIQKLYMEHRYTGISKWQERVKSTLLKTGQIEAASGHTRTFFGRRNDNSTFQAAYSQEPQANTTYATNLALYNLWNDPENRDSKGHLIIEPLHQVHDALVGQFDESLASWAVAKIRSYFSNTITIANQSLIIPFEGAYGPSWGEHPHKI